MNHANHMKASRRLGSNAAVVAITGGLTLVCLAGLFGLFASSAHGIPVPSPVYEIEATSGSHTASLLNLPVGQPGVVQAPIPVDVDGDLLPDVNVGVNLINTDGALLNPPQPGQILSPNIEINRFPTAFLTKPAPPLRIVVKLTVHDAFTNNPDTVLRFGYDTGVGGSIPQYWKAAVGGLDKFFNPLSATIDTTGAQLGLPPNLVPDLHTGSIDDPYQGPLSIIGQITTASTDAKLGLAYDPMPRRIDVTYANDSAGEHLTYAHQSPGEVDLTTTVALATSNGSQTDAQARVDRLPHSLALDFGSGSGGGSVAYAAHNDGRLPDVGLNLRSTAPGERPLNAVLDIDGLPAQMSARWQIPTDGQPGPVSAAFDATGQGIGAIQATVTNYDSSPGFTAFVPDQQQFLNLQQDAGEDPARLISGRIERVRHLEFNQTAAGGMSANAQLGDGELPLLAHAQIDLRHGSGESFGGVALEGRALVAPLPDNATIAFEPGSDNDPLHLHYEASQAIDVDAHAEIRTVATNPACGEAGAICGDVKARNLPTSLDVSVTKNGGENHIDIHSEPRPGGVQPDFFADLIIGPDVVGGGSSGDGGSGDILRGTPLLAHAELLGYPRDVRVLTRNGLDESLEAAEFHSCDYDFAAQVCTSGADDSVKQLSFNLRNWIDRPADLPPVIGRTPNYAAVNARGGADPTKVVFEAAGRVQQVKELDYRNGSDVFGVRTKLGGNAAFTADVDLGRIALSGDPTSHRFDITGHVLIPSLPDRMDVCLTKQGSAIAGPPSGSFTAPCENTNPFNDMHPLAKRPLAFAWSASHEMNVFAKAAVVDRGANDGDIQDDHTIAGELDVTNIPPDLAVYIDTPPKDTAGPIRAVYDAPAASGDQINIHFDARVIDGDLICADPRQPALNKQALCAKGDLQHLPTNVRVDYDPTKRHDNFSVVTSGTQKMNLANLELSRVAVTDAVGPLKLDDIVATANVLGIPRTLTGTIDPPRTVDLQTGIDPDTLLPDKIDSIVADARNFIAPDPTPAHPAAQRTDQNGNSLPSNPDQQLELYQRGDSFRAHVKVTNLRRIGFASGTTTPIPLLNPLGELDTKIINVSFAGPQTLRAYADLDNLLGKQLNGDVTLVDLPAALELCFRPADPTHVGPPDHPTFCDNVDAGDGAFQLAGSEGALTGLDVHAFFRMAQGGGSSALAARADVVDVPPVVQAQFHSDPDRVKVGGFADRDANGVGITQTGINEIFAEVANADIANTGYSTNPWDGTVHSTLEPLPNPPSGGAQFAHAALDDNFFHVQARIRQFEGFQFDHALCVADNPSDPTAPNPQIRQDYPHYPTAADTTTGHEVAAPDYMCLKARFTNENASEPLYLSALVDKGDTRIAVRDAGLSTIPSYFQAVIADAPTLNTNSSLRRPCGSEASEPDNAVDCVPPKVRIDTPGQTVLWGSVELGSKKAIQKIATLPVRDLDIAPAVAAVAGPTDFTPSNGRTEGVRARIISDDPSGPVVKGSVRVRIPGSFTLDSPQSWAQNGLEAPGAPYDSDHYWKASDMRFRYVARQYAADGVTPSVASPGDAIAVVDSLKDGSQIIASDPDNVGKGIVIPGELGINLFVRDYIGKGQKLIQLDGRTSSPINARVQMFGGPGATVGYLNGAVRNVPATTDDNPLNPSFRLQAMLLGSEADPPISAPDDPPSPIEEALLCVVFCLQTDVQIQRVDASFDFQPDSNQPAARLVKAVINQQGATTNGAQVQGWQAVNGGSAARIALNGAIVIDPLDIFFHVGIPIVGDFNFIMQSSLSLELNVGGADPSTMGTTDFSLREGLLTFGVQNAGPGSSSLDIDWRMYQFHALLFSILGFLPFFGGNPVLLGIDYLPPNLAPGDRVLVGFNDCDLGGLFGTINHIDFGGGSDTTFLLYPFQDPRFIFYGTLGFATKVILDYIVRPIFCAIGAPSASDLPLINSSFPGQPIPDTQGDIAQHAVPDLGATTIPPPTPPALGPLDIASGDNAQYCGEQNFSSVDISGTLEVATVAGPHCKAGSEGKLTMTVGGATVTDPVSLGRFWVHSGGAVIGNGGELTIGANNALVDGTISGASTTNVLTAGTTTVNGSISADALIDHQVFSFPPFINAPTGNGGGANIRWGGAGNPGSGGDAYGDSSTDLGSDGQIPASAGSRGGTASGGATGGNGGGVIRLLATDLVLTGPVSANGEAGHAGSDGDCAAGGPDEIPGGGGGAGGAVVVQAIQVSGTGAGTLSATGGDGGAGSGGGGGGSSGMVKVVAPLSSFDPAHQPNSVNGVSGASGCGGAAADGGFYAVIYRNDASSRAIANDQRFWFQPNNVPVDFVAATPSVPGPDRFVVVLCGKHGDPSATDVPDPESADHKAFRMKYGINMPTDRDYTFFGVDVCGHYPGDFPPFTTEYGDELASQSFSGTRASGTFDVSGFSDGYEGFYTIILTPTDSTMDCNDPIERTGCNIQALPGAPNTVVGVDGTRPSNPVVDPGPFLVSGPNVTLSVSQVTDYMGDPNRTLSGVAAVQCSNDNVNWTDCGPAQDGARQWTLLGGDGDRVALVRVIDQAGNVSLIPGVTTFQVDTTPPTVTITADSAPNRDHGWYSASPTFTINASDAIAGVEHITYWFDDGAPFECAAGDSCNVVDNLPVRGEHTLYAVATDNAGNRGARFHPTGPGDKKTAQDPAELLVKIDGDQPLVAGLTVPSAPDGKNGWFQTRPWLSVNGIDPGSGSGLTADPSAGTFVSVDGGAFAKVPLQQLDRGTHTACWFARDVAGNLDSLPYGTVPTTANLPPTNCTTLLVDPDDPTLAIAPVPATPNGMNGWYTTDVAVDFSRFDTVPGSGMNLDQDPALCDPLHEGDNVRPSGVCYSIDERPFHPWTGKPYTLHEGQHVVKAYGFDVSGRRTQTVERIINIDTSHPVTTARSTPPQSAHNGWWRALPTVTLRSVDGDQNAGVAATYYRLDGGAPTSYSGPIPITPDGVHTVEYWSVDKAGIVEASQRVTLPADTTAPVVNALSAKPTVWLKLVSLLGNVLGMSPKTAELNWEVTDATSNKVSIRVLIFDATGNVVRVLDGATCSPTPGAPCSVTPGVKLSGKTIWDGKDKTLTGLVPLGMYYYRVIAIDDAGNTAQSAESKPIQIKLG